MTNDCRVLYMHGLVPWSRSVLQGYSHMIVLELAFGLGYPCSDSISTTKKSLSRPSFGRVHLRVCSFVPTWTSLPLPALQQCIHTSVAQTGQATLQHSSRGHPGPPPQWSTCDCAWLTAWQFPWGSQHRLGRPPDCYGDDQGHTHVYGKFLLQYVYACIYMYLKEEAFKCTRPKQHVEKSTDLPLTGFESHTSRVLVWCSTNWATEAAQLGGLNPRMQQAWLTREL